MKMQELKEAIVKYLRKHCGFSPKNGVTHEFEPLTYLSGNKVHRALRELREEGIVMEIKAGRRDRDTVHVYLTETGWHMKEAA